MAGLKSVGVEEVIPMMRYFCHFCCCREGEPLSSTSLVWWWWMVGWSWCGSLKELMLDGWARSEEKAPSLPYPPPPLTYWFLQPDVSLSGCRRRRFLFWKMAKACSIPLKITPLSFSICLSVCLSWPSICYGSSGYLSPAFRTNFIHIYSMGTCLYIEKQIRTNGSKKKK